MRADEYPWRLGQMIRCTITDCDGKLTAITTHLHRSMELQLTRLGVNHNGEPFGSVWLPADQCQPVDEVR